VKKTLVALLAAGVFIALAAAPAAACNYYCSDTNVCTFVPYTTGMYCHYSGSACIEDQGICAFAPELMSVPTTKHQRFADFLKRIEAEAAATVCSAPTL
jgi:hypothetical protein